MSPVIQVANWKIELYDNMAGYQVLLVVDCHAVNDDAIGMALVVAAAVAGGPTVEVELSAIVERHLLTDGNLKELDLNPRRLIQKDSKDVLPDMTYLVINLVHLIKYDLSPQHYLLYVVLIDFVTIAPMSHWLVFVVTQELLKQFVMKCLLKG